MVAQLIRPDFYRTVFETAAVGIFESTLSGRLRRANPAFARLLGYSDPDALLGDDCDLATRHYAVPAHRDAMLRQLLLRGSVEGYIVETRRLDGARLWCSVSATLLPTPAGAEPCLIGTMIDVSEMIGAQERANTIAAEMSRVFDNATEGIYRSSPDGRQLRANPALVRLNGYETEAELLAAIVDIAREWYVDPGRRDEFRAALERDGRVVGFESEVYRHRTRERIWVSENAWVVRDADGRTLFYEGTVIDITERKRAAEALRQNEERLRDFAETASDWLWETDAEHRFCYMSPRVTMFGVPQNRTFGRTRFEIAGDVDTEPEKWRAHREALDRREPFRDFVYRNVFDNGQFIYASVSGKPVFDAQGRFLGYRGTARDVTEAVKAEERLREAMGEAEAANQAKISFLANMSHELRTPLNAILGFAEMIRDQILGPGNPRYKDYAGLIVESGEHLLTLVNDVLDMAKIDAGRLELSVGEVDLGELMAHQVALMRPRAEARGVAIALEVAVDLPKLRIDELRIRQVLLNLLSNAIKFTDSGGTIVASAGLDGEGRPVIAVADTGIGMTAEEVELAVQPFRQIQTHMDRTHEGTGLGLPISKNLVGLHGGELAIESEPGAGTTARVILPATAVIR